MDIRHTTPPHIVIDGYHLEIEKAWANRPCRIWPHHFLNGTVVAVILIAIGAALWAADMAQGVPA